jgi:pyrroline-5-carboxylate reductase
LGIVTTADNQQVVNKSDLLILAVKPKDVQSVLKDIRNPLVPDHHLLISIAAGIRTKTIEQVWIKFDCFYKIKKSLFF